MNNEQDKTITALKTAIQMEIDGKEYYLKTSRESSNALGQNLLRSLAAEEDIHRQKFEQIYATIRNKNIWPATDFTPDGGSGLRTVFARTTEEMSSAVDVSTTELDAVQKAMTMENKTYDFYKEQGERATYDAERELYEALVIQEREHYLILLDYYEFLKYPAAWFVEKEHPSLDGG